MRIDLTPTRARVLSSTFSSAPSLEQHAVSITHPSDHLTFEQVVELVKAALVAWGFAPSLVEDYFDPDGDDGFDKLPADSFARREITRLAVRQRGLVKRKKERK